jgi:GT2 family glycosyltransferase
MKDVSIIVVCYKGWARLTKCLESLDTLTGEKNSVEVIVVDNKSEDDAINGIKARFPRFSFIQNDVNGGFGNGNNLGSKSASGEYLLFLNPDTVACEEEVEKLLNVARQNPSFGIVSCSQVNEKGKESIATGPFPDLFNLTGFQRAIFGWLRAEGRRQKAETEFPDWISGSVILIRKELFIELGGFDDDFWMYSEDVDLCRRVRNLQKQVAFCRNISIEHNHGGSSRINLKTASLTKTEVHISRHVYISKHKRGFNKFLIQFFLVANNLITAGLMAVIGLIFFFVPKIFARTLIFIRLVRYYLNALLRFSWISPRSVNFLR